MYNSYTDRYNRGIPNSLIAGIGIGAILEPFINPMWKYDNPYLVDNLQSTPADKLIMGVSCALSILIISKILNNNNINNLESRVD